MDKIFQIQAVLTKYKSKANKSVQFTFDTQENMSPEHMSRLISLIDCLGWLNFAVRQIEATDLVNLPEPDKTMYDKGKTPAQRLRAVIFLVHKQKGGDTKDFPAYYDKAMEVLISQVKEKLE